MSCSKALVLTLGFDERFAIRGILRTGLSNGDRVTVFVAEPVVGKAEKALQVLMDFFKKYFEGVSVDVVSVPTRDFELSVTIIGGKLKELKGLNCKVVLNLSGGMRSLIIEILLTSILISLKGIVEIELENLEGYLSFPMEIFKVKMPMKEEHRLVLETIMLHERINISQISNKLGMAKSSIHKIIRKLAENGLIEYEKKGKEYKLRVKQITKIFID